MEWVGVTDGRLLPQSCLLRTMDGTMEARKLAADGVPLPLCATSDTGLPPPTPAHRSRRSKQT